jgi:hypothetical protein
MSRGFGTMERAILAVLDQWAEERARLPSDTWEGDEWDRNRRIHRPHGDTEVCYPARVVYPLDELRTRTYRSRRDAGGPAHRYSHDTAFSRALGRLCQRGMLVKVWECDRFLRCRCGQIQHAPRRNSSVVVLRKW